jgi:membrane-bound lytic murein transglycosylase D
MFRERALSKVAAAGLWQFMSGSAKKYMTVDPNLDERYDPVVATHGAARLLLRNHDLLGTWPLAINAYNSGPGNLQKAVQKAGNEGHRPDRHRVQDGQLRLRLTKLLPSFLAALDVYENHEKYFGPVRKEAPWTFDQIELPVTMTFPEIASLSGATPSNLKELNPAYSDAVLEGRFSLPAGTQIRLPSGNQPAFARNFVQFAASRVATTTVSAPLFQVSAAPEAVAPGPSLAKSGDEDPLAPIFEAQPPLRTSPSLPFPNLPDPSGLRRP